MRLKNAFIKLQTQFVNSLPKDIDVTLVFWIEISLTGLRVAFFFRLQHLFGLLEIV